jgi:hypothetical protein
MSDDLIKKMRGRIDQCRRLAASTTDQKAARILLQMADEGEADVRRLIAERDGAAASSPGSEGQKRQPKQTP